MFRVSRNHGRRSRLAIVSRMLELKEVVHTHEEVVCIWYISANAKELH